jgi:ethanolamine utilization cobalamin adenosyltransferase
MQRRQYLDAVLRLFTPDEIRRSAENPSKYMTRTHVLLHYAALKRLGNQTV